MTDHETAAGVGEREACWRAECQRGCYYPAVCSEQRAAEPSTPAASTDPAPEGGLREALPYAVEHGVECYHGTPEACGSLRCGSNCDNRFDRMHPCPACLIADIQRLRALVESLGGDPYAPITAHPAPETPEQVQGGGEGEAAADDNDHQISKDGQRWTTTKTSASSADAATTSTTSPTGGQASSTAKSSTAQASAPSAAAGGVTSPPAATSDAGGVQAGRVTVVAWEEHERLCAAAVAREHLRMADKVSAAATRAEGQRLDLLRAVVSFVDTNGGDLPLGLLDSIRAEIGGPR